MLFSYYRITNKINNKVYIGITEKTPEERWKQHQKALVKNKHPNWKLQEDWNSFSKDNFIFEVIEVLDCETIEIGYQKEYELIQEYNGEKYNILVGGQLNPMYTPEVKEKMTRTKQSQVPNIYQLKEIEENIFKVVGIFNSQKEASRQTEADQGNIQHALSKRTKGCGYYWVNEMSKEDFESSWRPSRTKITPCAELNEDGEIIKAHHNRSIFEKEYGWTSGCIKGAINRNGKTHNKKFINITEEEYYKIRPITLLF